jgi:phytoene desaturase
MTDKKKAIIIGSGIAGLATSIRLACAGWQVTVFEKNSYFGGKLSSFTQDGYVFDAGPSLFTQPHYIEELFALANVDIKKYFTYIRSDVTCNYFFADGTFVSASADANQFAQALSTTFNEDKNNVLQYLQRSKQAFENIGTLFTQYSLHKGSSYKQGRLWGALKATKLPYISTSLHSYNQRSFKHANTVQLFDRYATYNGSNPYKAPAMLSMIPHFEMNVGTYYPMGGMISITNALVQLATEVGVQLVTDAPVTNIVTQHNKAIGAVVDKQQHLADAVVSNMDVYYSYKQLLQDTPAANKVLQQQRSSSAFIFYWGVNKTIPNLHLHNIFFSADYAKEFTQIFTDAQLPDAPTIYVNIPAKMEQGLAPDGCENWFVMVNAPAHTTQNWQALQTTLRTYIIQVLEKQLQQPIAQHIVTEAVLTPLDIQTRTSSYMGSLYGSSSNSKAAAFMRQQNKSKQYSNLYFVGGSVHPGGGIPLCLGSAQIVADWMAEDFAG